MFFGGDRHGSLDNSFEVSRSVRTDAAIYYRLENFKTKLGFKDLFNVKYIEAPCLSFLCHLILHQVEVAKEKLVFAFAQGY